MLDGIKHSLNFNNEQNEDTSQMNFPHSHQENLGCGRKKKDEQPPSLGSKHRFE